MGKSRQFLQNSFWLAVSTGSVVLVGAAYRPIVARFLGEAVYGRYVFIQTFVTYFLIVAYFGIRAVVTREIGRDESATQAYVAKGFRIRVVTILISIVACCLAGYLLKRGPDVTLGIYVLSLSIVTLGLGDLLEGALIALGRSLHIAIANLIGNVLKLVFGLMALRAGYGLLGVLWVFVLTSAVTTAILWHFLLPILRRSKEESPNPIRTRYLVGQAAPFLVMYLSQRLYGKNDILILSFLRGDAVTGVYAAAYVFFDLLMNLGNCFTQAAYPIIARLHGKAAEGITDGYDLANAYERLHRHMLMLLLPTAVLFTWLAHEALALVFGKAFLAGVAPMRILAWWPVLEVSCLVSGNFISGTYRQKLEAGISVAMSAISIAWTVLFVLRYGMIGAAVATVGASAINAAVRYFYIRRLIGAVRLKNIWVKPIACGAVMFVAVYAVADASWAVKLMAGLAAYALAILIVRPYDKEDKRLLLSALGR